MSNPPCPAQPYDLDPGLRRGERWLNQGRDLSPTPGHTGEGRYPGRKARHIRKGRASPKAQPYELDPGLRRGERWLNQGRDLSPTPGHIGEGRYPGPRVQPP